MDDEPVAPLVRAAAEGDRAAWDALAERFSPRVWRVIRAFRLSAADSADVNQTVWLRLVENLDRIVEPERLAAWLATTARNECLAVIRRAGRQRPVDAADELDDRPAATPDVEHRLLAGERQVAVRQAFQLLGDRCQLLLRLWATDPRPSYAEIGAALDMPIGSIGPTRGRCLQELRVKLGEFGISGDAADSG